MTKPLIEINVFTDPNCPFAYSAEPTRWRLRWLYGDQLSWKYTMITLSGYQGEVPTITPEQSASFQKGIREQHKMPIDITVRARSIDTIKATRAVVAASRYSTVASEALLRNLRVASMSGRLIDETDVINAAAQVANINPDELNQWMQEPETEELLNAQAEAARNPGPLSAAFKHKLSKTSTDRVRYSAPSYKMIQNDQVVFELPGFWPLEAYEAGIGNLAPTIERNAKPSSVSEVLQWAGTPLATIEVATIMGIGMEKARNKLSPVANFKEVGQDGFWTLK